MNDSIFNYYQKNITDIESQLKRIRKIGSWLYLMRLFTFVLVIAFLVLFVKFHYNYVFVVFSISSFALFLLAVSLDINYDNQEKFLANKLLINKNELNFLAHNYSERPTGVEYSIINPQLAADFDIFGNGSVFQYLNRSSTKIGEKNLAENLCQQELNSSLIFEKQQSIRELSNKLEFLQNFQAKGMFISEKGNETESLNSWLVEPEQKVKLLRFLSFALPILNAVWIIMVALGVFSFNSLGLPLTISIFIVLANAKRINTAHAKLGKTTKTFEKYSGLIELIEKEIFTTSYISVVKNKLNTHNSKASKSLKKLFKLLQRFDLRYNIIVSFVLNTFLLFDIHVYFALLQWKKNHKNAVDSWLSCLSEMDALASFAVYAANNNSRTCYPEVTDKDFIFDAKKLGHPLLPQGIGITNSISFAGTPSIIIITGANMAGKSTFLRTLSVNVILAMCGAPVCAEKFTFSPSTIMSSIKIQDSLLNNESYFYAELLRLKVIIDHVKQNPKTIVFLDEILRGTNTKDKQLGSLGILEKMISLNAVVVIATHDLLIGELENTYPGIVRNHCFEVELTNDQLIFDYVLKSGISQKLNASYLMKKMEIIS